MSIRRRDRQGLVELFPDHMPVVQHTHDKVRSTPSVGRFAQRTTVNLHERRPR